MVKKIEHQTVTEEKHDFIRSRPTFASLNHFIFSKKQHQLHAQNIFPKYTDTNKKFGPTLKNHQQHFFPIDFKFFATPAALKKMFD